MYGFVSGSFFRRIRPTPCSKTYSIYVVKMHTVNNLSPGVVETPRTDEPTPPIPDDISQRMSIPVGFEGQPNDIAGMALLLCSDAGRYITDQTIFVDGGMGL